MHTFLRCDWNNVCVLCMYYVCKCVCVSVMFALHFSNSGYAHNERIDRHYWAQHFRKHIEKEKQSKKNEKKLSNRKQTSNNKFPFGKFALLKLFIWTNGILFSLINYRYFYYYYDFSFFGCLQTIFFFWKKKLFVCFTVVVAVVWIFPVFDSMPDKNNNNNNNLPICT